MKKIIEKLTYLKQIAKFIYIHSTLFKAKIIQKIICDFFFL